MLNYTNVLLVPVVGDVDLVAGVPLTPGRDIPLNNNRHFLLRFGLANAYSRFKNRVVCI